MDLSVVPDLTMRGQDDPHGRAGTVRPPTVGQLAARVRDLAAHPGEWWGLVRFDDGGPVHIPLDDDTWLTTWPPGHGGTVHDQVSTLIAGEVAEVTITGRGVTGRPLPANRVRVHGGSSALTNPGPAFAVTLHAGAARSLDRPAG
ncbi:cysteine dioxygenase [Actinomadura darangshiensis]|uniref:Cysteine dioxygenase n=1 Tax=Actinomadura darangshiensis TaxID=705336 RepID=A0A4R5B6K6_9ACTN|nr:cysteine dioxygenase [Actinomadura darangshiensis]TDD80965.1 cysteine dioxygenase [Actinomadura darangshiensis]